MIPDVVPDQVAAPSVQRQAGRAGGALVISWVTPTNRGSAITSSPVPMKTAGGQSRTARTGATSVGGGALRTGPVTPLHGVTAQNTAYTNQRTALTIINSRLAASVLLIKALGGRWDAADGAPSSAPAGHLLPEGEGTKSPLPPGEGRG